MIVELWDQFTADGFGGYHPDEVSSTLRVKESYGGGQVLMVVDPKVSVLNPWDSQGNQITDERGGVYPTIRGCGGAGYQQGYLLASIGVDLYNQSTTGEVSKTLNAIKSDSDHVPCVISSSKASFFTQTTEDVASVLVATDYKDPPIIVDDSFSIENHPNDSRMGIDPQGKVQTLSASMGMGGNNTPMAMVTYRKTAHPQNSEQPQNYEITDKADTLNIFDNTEGRTPILNVEDNQMEDNNYRVRRLTPTECERLQGFPDGWTDIGEWTDSKGKVRQTTDSARYKALGNSIGLPPWKWVLKRISAQYERDATMASLFDGIAGFPFLWEQLNGRGSCLWASEIEEFCIAVTEKRINGKDTVDLRNL